jgi:hypothetical protein
MTTAFPEKELRYLLMYKRGRFLNKFLKEYPLEEDIILEYYRTNYRKYFIRDYKAAVSERWKAYNKNSTEQILTYLKENNFNYEKIIADSFKNLYNHMTHEEN